LLVMLRVSGGIHGPALLECCGSNDSAADFLRDDRPTAPSNLEFDRSLRARDSNWGIRHLDDILAKAKSAGLELDEIRDMPNNNYSLILRKL
jgi:hypothetical protein